MIVNPDKVINGIVTLFDQNKAVIDTLINLYLKGRELTILKGERKVIANTHLPALELEPATGEASWFACRVQRADFSIRVILTMWNGNEALAQEFLGLLTTMIARILMWPPTIQRRIPETDFYLVDSGVKGLQYTTIRQGSIRQAEFIWYGWTIEHFDNRLFLSGGEGITGAPPDSMLVPQAGAL